MNTRFVLCLTIVATIALSGCLEVPMPEIVIPTMTTIPQSPDIDDSTLLSIALDDISGDHGQYSVEDRAHPKTDEYLIIELNKILSNRAYKEAFDANFEVINAAWLTPNGNPDMVDVLLMINCNGRQDDDCTIQKTTSETIFVLRWLPGYPFGNSSSVHSVNVTNDGRFWIFPANTRYVFFYTYDTKIPEGWIRVSGEHLNIYINGHLPGETLSTQMRVEPYP